MAYSLNPLKWHNQAMNQVDQANRSESFFLIKAANQVKANSLATVTGVCATGYFCGKLALSVPGAIMKNKLAIIRFVTRDDRDDRGYHKLPGVKDCLITAKKTLSQAIGVFTSLSGVLIIGSELNAEKQRKLGNCSEYESEIKAQVKTKMQPVFKDIYQKSIEKEGETGIVPGPLYIASPKKVTTTALNDEVYENFIGRLVQEGVKKFYGEKNEFESINLEFTKFLRTRFGKDVNLRIHEIRVQQKIIATIDKSFVEMFENLNKEEQADIGKAVKGLKILDKNIPQYITYVKLLINEGIKQSKGENHEFEQIQTHCLKYLSDRENPVDLNKHLALIDTWVEANLELQSNYERYLDFKRQTVLSGLQNQLITTKGANYFNKLNNLAQIDSEVSYKMNPNRVMRVPLEDKVFINHQHAYAAAASIAQKIDGTNCTILDQELETVKHFKNTLLGAVDNVNKLLDSKKNRFDGKPAKIITRKESILCALDQLYDEVSDLNDFVEDNKTFLETESRANRNLQKQISDINELIPDFIQKAEEKMAKDQKKAEKTSSPLKFKSKEKFSSIDGTEDDDHNPDSILKERVSLDKKVDKHRQSGHAKVETVTTEILKINTPGPRAWYNPMRIIDWYRGPKKDQVEIVDLPKTSEKTSLEKEPPVIEQKKAEVKDIFKERILMTEDDIFNDGSDDDIFTDRLEKESLIEVPKEKTSVTKAWYNPMRIVDWFRAPRKDKVEIVDLSKMTNNTPLFEEIQPLKPKK